MNAQWDALLTKAINFVPALIAALVIAVVSVWVANWLAKWVQRLLQRRQVDHELTVLLAHITRWGTIGLGLAMALQQIGFDITAFLAGLGVLGFTVGFAIQDVSKNFIAGILLLLQQPFDIGDAIEINGYGGKVEEISLRATAIRTFDGRLVYIPNADVYTSAIVNFSRTQVRRLDVTVGVAYGTDLDHAKAIAQETIAHLPGVSADPAPMVVFHTFNDSSVDMTIYFWIETAHTGIWEGKDAAVRAIYEAFNRAGIEIPYPIQTVLLNQPLPTT